MLQELILECTVDGSSPPIITGDAMKLKQVLLNIVNNAIKFYRQGRQGTPCV